MSRIKGKNTGIEISLRKELTKRGLHYRHNSHFVFGHPDVSFKGYKVAVFCDSEFWHGYNFEVAKSKIHSNTDYWITKIERNIARDKKVNEELAGEGFIVVRFWGNEINDDVSLCADKVVDALMRHGYKQK